MLSPRQAEETAGIARQRLDILKHRRQLPFDEPNRPFTILRYSPMNALALNLQAAFLDDHGLAVSDAAGVVKEALPVLGEEWKALVRGELWITVVRKPVPRKQRRGSRAWDADVYVFPMEKTNELIGLVRQNRPEWAILPVSATRVLKEMLERARAKGIELPPVADCDAWRRVEV